MRRKNRLKILLIILISIFIMFAAAALLLASFQKSAREAQQKKEAIENAAKLTPTPEVRHRGRQQHRPRFRSRELHLIRMISGITGTVQTDL